MTEFSSFLLQQLKSRPCLFLRTCRCPYFICTHVLLMRKKLKVFLKQLQNYFRCTCILIVCTCSSIHCSKINIYRRILWQKPGTALRVTHLRQDRLLLTPDESNDTLDQVEHHGPQHPVPRLKYVITHLT